MGPSLSASGINHDVSENVSFLELFSQFDVLSNLVTNPMHNYLVEVIY